MIDLLLDVGIAGLIVAVWLDIRRRFISIVKEGQLGASYGELVPEGLVEEADLVGQCRIGCRHTSRLSMGSVKK